MAVAQAERGVATGALHENGRKPLINEVRALGEFFNIQFHPIYYGIGVPHGDNSPVIPIPGLFSSDWHLIWQRSWLRRIGYQSYPSGINFANMYPDRHMREITGRIERIQRHTNRRVKLIGHSLGGIYAKLIALSRPDLIESIVTLGSPLNGNHDKSVDPIVLALGKTVIPLLRNPDEVGRRSRELSNRLPPGIGSTNIYSKGDGVVGWPSCIDPDPQATNIEVSGTHAGLIWNPQVYKHIATALARAR